MTSNLTERRAWTAALIVTAAGFLIRLSGISEWWLNPDEGIYYSMLTWSDSAKFWQQMAENAHPPLFYLATRQLGFLTTDFVAIRVVSVVFGTIAIYAAWLVGKEISGAEGSAPLIGLASALLVACSPGAISLSQVMRPYMMQLALLLIALYWLLRYRRDRQASSLVLYSGFLSLTLLTHYSSFLAFAVFSALILLHLNAGGWKPTEVLRMLAATTVPACLCVALYLQHVRNLAGSAIAIDALDGWLAPFMIDSISDVAARFYGFMGYLVGPRLAGPAVLVWITGVLMAIRRRSWSLVVVSLTAFCIAVVAASTGQYPLGACRHATWLVTFFVFPLAYALAQTVTPALRVKTSAAALVSALILVGSTADRLMGPRRPSSRLLREQVLKRSDMERVLPMVTRAGGPDLVFTDIQCFNLLLPLYLDEREVVANSSDGSFFSFRWGGHQMIVARSWNLSTRPTEIREPYHLYALVQSVDREIPELEIGNRHEALVLIGGWNKDTPQFLLRADQSLPPDARLVTRHEQVPGLSIMVVDIARYRLMMRETLDNSYR